MRLNLSKFQTTQEVYTWKTPPFILHKELDPFLLTLKKLWLLYYRSSNLGLGRLQRSLRDLDPGLRPIELTLLTYIYPQRLWIVIGTKYKYALIIMMITNDTTYIRRHGNKWGGLVLSSNTNLNNTINFTHMNFIWI